MVITSPLASGTKHSPPPKATAQQAWLIKADDSRRGTCPLASAPHLQQRELSPFIVDMENDGQLSRTGLFRTQDDDLRALVENHLPHAVEAWGLDAQQPIDLAIFAHGGINSENDAQEHAAYWIPKLYERQIFPAFLITSLMCFSIASPSRASS